MKKSGCVGKKKKTGKSEAHPRSQEGQRVCQRRSRGLPGEEQCRGKWTVGKLVSRNPFNEVEESRVASRSGSSRGQSPREIRTVPLSRKAAGIRKKARDNRSTSRTKGLDGGRGGRDAT